MTFDEWWKDYTPSLPISHRAIALAAWEAGALSEMIKIRHEVERHGRKVEELSNRLTELIADIERTMLGQQRVQ